jgi:predicted ATPase
MQAIVDQDRIVRLVMAGGVEIGRVPKNAGLERLRWNGEEIIDLLDVAEMWVRPVAGGFVLHVIPVAGAQRLDMTWADRKRLVLVNGVVEIN